MNIPPRLKIGESIVVAVSRPHETRWGFTQFPSLSPLPDGRILLVYADAEDASETHGEPAPALVSTDQGSSWQPFVDDLVPTRPHYSVTPAFHGEFLTVPTCRYFNVKQAGITLPQPVSEAYVYGPLFTYRVADFGPEVHEYFHHPDARRWHPSTGSWAHEKVSYDANRLLAWRRDGSDLLPRSFFERPALQHRGDLLYADYRVRYATQDGYYPGKGGTTLMASSDNGHTFTNRAIVALDRSGRDLYGEPALAETSDGGLVCVLRKTDHEQKPMAICHSNDAGHTWSDPVEFCAFGVFPYLVRLSSGPLVLSYGRPGVWLRFNLDGYARNWSEPISLIKGDAAAVGSHTCGYTGMIAVGPRSILVTYSDFDHRDQAGVPRKAILCRRIDLMD